MFCTTFRQSQSCKHVFFLRANRQYHLNTITNNTHTHLDGRVLVLMTTHRITRHRPTFCFVILRCRIFFSLRRRCRHVSDCTSADQTNKFYPSVVVCTATTDDGNRSFTVCACGSLEQRPRNLLRGVCGAIVEMLTDLVTRPAQRESKEQGCNTKLERRGGVEFRPTSDFVTRSEDPKVTAYDFKWC